MNLLIKLSTTLFIVLFFASCQENTTTPLLKDIASVEINENNITMHATDAPKTIDATVTFTDGSTADAASALYWSSSNEDIVSVSSGELSAGVANGGEATIQADYEQYSDSATVTVSKLTGYSVSFPEINATGTYIFKAYGEFDNGDKNITIADNIVWSADNDAVVEVTDGVASITLVAGETNVTATLFGDTNESSPIAPQSKIYTIN